MKFVTISLIVALIIVVAIIVLLVFKPMKYLKLERFTNSKSTPQTSNAMKWNQYRWKNDTGPKVSEIFDASTIGSGAMDTIANAAFKTYVDETQAKLDLHTEEALREPEGGNLLLYKPDFKQIDNPSTNPFVKSSTNGLVYGPDITARL
jgi:hypothetical protein